MSKSQAEIEAQLYREWAQLRKTRCIIDAFGAAQDWIVELGRHKILLNPFYKTWLYYDHTHDTWNDTGYKIGEVLFVPFNYALSAFPIHNDNQRNVQTNTELRPVTEWYIYLQMRKLGGPILQTELKQKLLRGDLPSDSMIFNAAMIEWKRADAAGLLQSQNERHLFCPACKAEYSIGDLFCAACGFDLRTKDKICSSCGSKLQPDDLFCPACGKKI